MSVVLTVDEAAWRAHVDTTLAAIGVESAIPVVKGNGYGFGRPWLARHAVGLGARTIAVGTIHELAGLVDLGATVLVLTPTQDIELEDLPTAAVSTVGSTAHAYHLVERRSTGRVVVKLASSMRRYGLEREELGCVDGLHVLAFAIHLPLAGTATERAAEIETWLPVLPAGIPLDVSHIDLATFARLRDRHPGRTFRLRLGTALWHGDKIALSLSADVVDVRSIAAGVRAGYRATPAPTDGHLVMIGGGTAHGITPLDDGRSPFHHARRRLTLLEPPHMHTSMAFVPDGDPLPCPGELVDVQRPLTMTAPDRVVWTR